MPTPQPIPGVKYPVKSGLQTLDQPMTRAQAERHGKRRMPSDLKAAGFNCVVSYVDNAYWQGIENATPYFRINYGK